MDSLCIFNCEQLCNSNIQSDLVAIIDSLDRLRSLSAGDQIRCLPDNLKKAKPVSRLSLKKLIQVDF